jgi:hypothetical protein
MRKRQTIRSDARGVCSARVALIECLRTAFDQRSWHGANLLGSIRSVHASAASQRIGGRKTIWQQVLHAAYWKHVVVNKLAGTTRFPRQGSNWPRMPDDRSETAWKADVELLKSTQRRLIEVVESLQDDRLDDKQTRWLIQGAAAHDLYHAGQIKLLRKMLSKA